MAIPIGIILLVNAFLGTCQQSSAAAPDSPIVVVFVAPPYPRAAKGQRISGRAVVRVTVNREGVVTSVRTVKSHRVFESAVLGALRQWRFKPSERDYALEVTCIFEFAVGKCNGSVPQTITPETYVSAELPSVVRIRTDLQCNFDR